MWAFHNSLDEYNLQSKEDLEKIKEEREPLDSPTCPHVKVQPEKQGKLFWLSGPPGSGKSTTCQLMARKCNFVYYEADCTMVFVNPFVDPDVDNPTMAAFQQKPLKVTLRLFKKEEMHTDKYKR